MFKTQSWSQSLSCFLVCNFISSSLRENLFWVHGHDMAFRRDLPRLGRKPARGQTRWNVKLSDMWTQRKHLIANSTGKWSPETHRRALKTYDASLWSLACALYVCQSAWKHTKIWAEERVMPEVTTKVFPYFVPWRYNFHHFGGFSPFRRYCFGTKSLK